MTRWFGQSVHIPEEVNVQENTEDWLKYIRNKLDMIAWSASVKIDSYQWSGPAR